MRSPLLPEVDLSGPTLILAPEQGPQTQVQTQTQAQTQVMTVDLTGLEWGDVAGAVGAARAVHPGPVGVVSGGARQVAAALAAGIDLVIVDGTSASSDHIQSITGSGTVALVNAVDRTRAAEVWDELEAQGVDRSRVVVEIGPSPDLVAQLVEMVHSGRPWRIGADLHAQDSPEGAGWQIGCLVGGAGLALATIRNVSPDRVRRVRAVLDALGVAEAGTAETGAEW